MRRKPSNPASPASPAMMDETTSGTMIILSAWRKRSPSREQMFRVWSIQLELLNCLSVVPTMMANTRAMMICQWAATFFMGVAYR